MRPSLCFLVACVGAGCSSSSPGDLFSPDDDAGVARDDASAESAVSLVLSSDALDFGLADCGGPAPAARSVTVTNGGASAVAFTADVDAREAFAIDGAATGALLPGASRTLSLVAQSIPGSTAPAATLRGTFNVRVSGIVRAHAALTVTAHGGAVVAPAQVGFGTLQVGEAAELAVSVSNMGNAPLTVSFGVSPDAEFIARWDGYPKPTMLAPGDTLPGATLRFAPTAPGSPDVAVPILVTGAVCGGATSPIELIAHAVAPPADGGSDASPSDAGAEDASSRDAAAIDAASPDASLPADAAASDGSIRDAGPDGESPDAEPADAAEDEGGALDAGEGIDAGQDEDGRAHADANADAGAAGARVDARLTPAGLAAPRAAL